MFYQFNHLGSPDYMKIERGENFSFPPHLHQCFEIILLLDGQMEVTVDGHVQQLQRGQGLLIFPNQIHALHSKESRHLLCIFSPHLVQAFSAKLTGKAPLNSIFSPDDYLVQALDRLEPSASSMEKKGVLYSLCGQFDKTAQYVARKAETEKLLFQIFSFVESQYAGDCSLTHLAAQTGYDYAYLSRYFKKIVGLSYNAYVNHYRLSHACYLLENSHLPIIQCAFESGYTALRSFNRNFKAHLQMTPAEYRRSTRQ